MDREKVLTWLEICGKNRDCSGNCPYGDGSGEYEDRLCREDLMTDALALLKEQEAVEPWLSYDGKEYIFHCSNCDYEIYHNGDSREEKAASKYAKFCRHCGRAVKWE